MKSEIKARLQFSDFTISPDELSNKLGISATESWLKGEPGVLTGVKTKSNGWVLDSGLEPLSDFAAHVTALLEKIRPHKKKFIEVAAKHHPILSCVVSSYDGDRPYIGFEASVVKELAELNATIDIDLYVL